VVKKGTNIERTFFDRLSPKLNELRDGYFYLTGMFDDDTAELILTADGEVKNFIFVEELVGAAPSIKGWKFTAHKQASDIKDVGIKMSGFKFQEDNLSFYPNDDPRYPDEINITIVHHDFDGESGRNDAVRGVYIFLDNFLGELNFATTIDSLHVVGKREAKTELIPVRKLKDYLIWREKEFLEKYDGMKQGTENNSYAVLEAELKDGKPLVATINTDLLTWDGKASHPWILNVEVKYGNPEKNNGMPDQTHFDGLSRIEDKLSDDLKDFDGYLNIGRQTANGVREIYFACKDFRKSSKVTDRIIRQNADQFEITYSIYKDKYWRSFERFKDT
jgi:hypothetical protein